MKPGMLHGWARTRGRYNPFPAPPVSGVGSEIERDDGAELLTGIEAPGFAGDERPVIGERPGAR